MTVTYIKETDGDDEGVMLRILGVIDAKHASNMTLSSLMKRLTKVANREIEPFGPSTTGLDYKPVETWTPTARAEIQGWSVQAKPDHFLVFLLNEETGLIKVGQATGVPSC